MLTNASATESRRSLEMNFLPYTNQNFVRSRSIIAYRSSEWPTSGGGPVCTGWFGSVPLDSRANLFSNKQTKPKLTTTI